ncbi:RagB/SusD family nutrient uptake outer membrane protein [Parabacteroides goldsteinii]|jgi:SusD family.|uniref:RagB/SusD family nutrient uptake outer membrane protein n=1 Tax=Parabacteroides goldsteinii TaxID=328812 RepID=UPI0024907479|nr:RagB/SusD family nutrient uptake outer membrane protein [Parabacteroides goldsteinii]
MKLNNVLNKKMLAVLASSFLLCGCEDFLTNDHPTGITDEDFWKTQDECNKALGACGVWPGGSYYYDPPYMALMHMEGMTDNMHWAGNFKGEIAQIGNGTATATTGGYMSDFWSDFYKRIRRCNRFLENVNSAYFIDEKERERMIAEAKTWRAWHHMRLLMYYGYHDGIPIVDKSLNGTEIYKGRNSVEDVLAFINKDLDEVIAITDEEVFPWVFDDSRRSRMCRSYALMLKIDVNLQFKKYDVVKAACQQFFSLNAQAGNKGYELYYNQDADDEDPGKHYRDMFRYVGHKNKEFIIYKGSGASEAWFRNAPQSLSGQGASGVLKSLVDEFETAEGVALKDLPADERTKYEHDPLYKPRDPRLYATVIVPNDNTSISGFDYKPFEGADNVGTVGAVKTGYIVKKFLDEQDRSNPSGGSLNYPYYRYAEVLLDYVESLVETGEWQNADVEKYINMIRNRAGMPNMDKKVYNSQEKVRELYRRERRVEFSFENKRYWDIRRWGIGNETMNGPALGAYNPATDNYVRLENRTCTFPKYDAWPLPQDELNSNPNIEQTLGW